MANTIDTEIIKLQFDHKQFAENVSETMILLQKLQESLQFQDAGRGFTSLEKAANAVQLTGIQNSIDAVEKKFSAFGIAGARVIWDLTGLVEQKLGGALKTLWGNTLGQAKSGGFRRALNIAQADFQMRGLLKDAENMEEQVKLIKQNINDAVTGTAYSYDAAAKVGAQLLASQVKPGEDMLKALRAVSGLAAMTNTSYEEIGNIMTDIAGAGRLTNEMLTRFSYRGMNATAALAKQLGKTEEQVKKMVKEGKIDFQTFANAMDDAFGEHATAANETYSGSLDNMKAALSRIGAVYYESHLNVMKDVFNALRVAINKVKVAITPFIEKINALERVIADAFIKRVEKFTEWLGNTKWVKSLKEANKATEEAAKTLGKYDEIVKQVIRGDFGNGKKRIEKLTAANWDYATVQALVNKECYGYNKAVKDLTDDEIKKIAYDEAQLKALTALRDAEKKAAEEGKKAASEKPIVKTLTNFKIAIENFKIGFKEIGKGIRRAFREVFNFNKIGDGIVDIMYIISDLFRELSEYFGDGSSTAERWYEIFKLIFTVVRDTVGLIVGVIKKVAPPLLKFLFSALYVIFNFISNIAQKINAGIQIVKRVWPVIKKELINPFLDFVSKKLKPITDLFGTIWDKLLGASVAGFDPSFKAVPEEVIQPIEEKIIAFSNWLKDIPNKVKNIISKLPLDKIKGFFEGIYNHPLTQKFVDKIKELAEHFKKLGEKLDEVPLSFQIFIDLAKDGKKYVDKFREALDKAKEKLGELKDKFIELGYLDQLKGYIEIIKGRLDRLWVTMRPFFKEKIPDMFGKLVGQVKTLYGQIKDSKPIEFLVDSVKNIIDGLTSGRYLNNLLDDLLAVKDLIVGLFTGEMKTGSGVGIGAGMLQLDTDDKSFAAVGKKIEELSQPIKDALANIFGDPKELYNKTKESIHNFLQGIADAMSFKSFNESTAKKLLVALAIIVAAIKLFNTIKNLMTSKNAAEEIMHRIADVFESLSGYIDAKSMNITAKSMWEVAKSFALIVASIYAIAQLDDENLSMAVGAIGAVLLTLAAFMWALGTLEQALAKRDQAKLANKTLADAAKNMEKNQELLKSLSKGLTEALKALTEGIGKAAQKVAKGIATSLIIVAFVYALKNMAEIINTLSKVQWDAPEVLATLGWMAIIIGYLTAVVKVLDIGKNHASIGDALSIVAVAYSLTLIGGAIEELRKSVNKRGFDEAMKIMRTIMTFMVILAAVMKNASYTADKTKKFAMQSKGGPFVGLAVAVVAMAGALYIIGHALKVIASVPEDGFEKAKGIFGLFGGLLIVMLALSKDWKAGKGGASGGAATLLGLGVMAIMMAVALNMLVPALTALTIVAHFDPGALILSAAIIGILMVIMGIMSGLAKGGTGMLKAAASLVIAAYAVQILTDALIILSTAVNAGGVFKSIGALVLVLGVLAIAVAGLTVVMNSGFAPALWAGIAALVAISGAIWLIGNGLYYFNKALLLAGSALPVFGQGLVNLCKIIFENAPTIIAAVFTVIAGVAMAIIMSSNIVAAAVVTLIIAVATAAIFALSQVSEETMQQAGEMLGGGIVKLFIFLWSAIWQALCTLCNWLYTNGPKFFFQQLPKLLAGLATIISYVIQFVWEIFSGLFGWLIDRLWGLFGRETDFFNKWRTALDPVFDKVRGWLKKITGKADEEIKEPKNPLGDPDAITENADAVANAYQESAQKISAAQEEVHGKTFMPLGDEGTTNTVIPPELAPEKIQEDTAATTDALNESKASIGEVLKNYLIGEDGVSIGGIKIGSEGVSLGTDLGDNVVNGLTTSFTNGKPVVEGNMLDLFASDDIKAKLKEQGVDITSGSMIEGVDTAFNEADVSSFGTWVNKLVDFGNSELEINSPSKVTMETGSSMMEGLEVGMENRSETTKGVFANAISGVLDGIGGVMSGLGERASSALGSFQSAISDGMTAATSSIEGFNTSATNAVSGLPEALGEKASGAATKFKKGLDDGKRGILNAAISIANAVTGNVSLYSRMYNLGVNAVQGFVNGIRSRIQSAANAAAEMADRSSESARSHLDVNSPSKVFRALGYSVGEGFIQGIERMTPAVSKVSGQMADDSIDGFKNALVAVDNLLSSNLDYTPTITPVLDLEDLQTGLGTLNTMMARNSALSMLTGSDTRNSKWALQRSLNNSLNAIVASSGNADIVDAINSLKEDNAELRAAISSMKVVMNNRFVGQIDTSLGRQQKMVNRG